MSPRHSKSVDTDHLYSGTIIILTGLCCVMKERNVCW